MSDDIKEFKTAVTWTDERVKRCDPYLVWADVTTAPDEDASSVAVLVELNRAEDYGDFRQLVRGGHIDFVPNSLEQGSGTRFLTGFVALSRLGDLVDQVGKAVVKRFTLQQSRTDLLNATEGWKHADLTPLEYSEKVGSWAKGMMGASGGTGTFVGVIDDGFPLHLVSAWVSNVARPVHFWDQGWQPRQTSPQAVPQFVPDDCWQHPWGWYEPQPGAAGLTASFRGFLYGRELTSIPANVSDAYARIRYFVPAPRHTHGAAVLGLAAPWLANRQAPRAWPEHVSGLALVQLPTCTVEDTSGGSLAMRVLDGLRYILWQERMSRPATGARPVAVNISYGVHAGPHDGSSMFERAVEEVLLSNEKLHVVLPAGNSHLAGCHARREIKEAPVGMDVYLLPDNASDVHVELWLSTAADVRLKIQPPGPAEPLVIEKGQAKIQCQRDGDTPTVIHCAAVYADQAAQSDQRTMILVTIGSTRNDLAEGNRSKAPGLNHRPRRVVQGRPGLWRLTIENKLDDPVTVDAWIERDDAAPDCSGGSRQAYFPDSGVKEIRRGNATPEGTLNGIATLKHNRAHVVGAMRRDGQLARYSAACQDGLDLPNVVATADWSLGLPGLRTMGFAPGSITRINGTSAACAVFARALAKEPLPFVAPPPDQTPAQSRKVPIEPPPVPERQPEAPKTLRGEARRQQVEFEVYPVNKNGP